MTTASVTSENSWMRSFTAIPLTPELVANLAEAANALQKLSLRAAWTPPERMHITLTFNGDLPADRVTGLIQALQRMLAPETAFRVTVKGMGVFGRPASPRVVWAGIDEGRDALSRLREKIAGATVTAGIDLETRPYHPHITLGRIRGAVHPGDRPALQECVQKYRDRVFGGQWVRRVDVMRSELNPDGVRHIALQTIPLQDP